MIGRYSSAPRKKEVENAAVWLRVRILNSLVFSFSTTVRAIRDSLREAAHVCAASKLHFLFPCSESIAVQLRKYCRKTLQQAASRIRLRSV